MIASTWFQHFENALSSLTSFQWDDRFARSWPKWFSLTISRTCEPTLLELDIARLKTFVLTISCYFSISPFLHISPGSWNVFGSFRSIICDNPSFYQIYQVSHAPLSGPILHHPANLGHVELPRRTKIELWPSRKLKFWSGLALRARFWIHVTTEWTESINLSILKAEASQRCLGPQRAGRCPKMFFFWWLFGLFCWSQLALACTCHETQKDHLGYVSDN